MTYIAQHAAQGLANTRTRLNVHKRCWLALNRWHQQCHRCSRLVIRAQQPDNSSSSSITTTTSDVRDTTQPTSSADASSSKSAPASATGPSFLSTPQHQSAGFLLLTAASLAFATAACAFPDALLSLAVGGSGGALDVAFTRIAGATMLISAAVEYSLQDAVTAGHLKSATYQRLLLAIMLKDVLYLTAYALSPGLWSPLLTAVYPGAAGGSLIITAATLSTAFQQSGAASSVEGVRAAVGDFRVPRTTAGWVYSVFILLYLGTAAACYAPEAIFTGAPLTPVALLLKHTWAPGFLLAAVSCWVLADAADRDRLAASTFRRLNLGIAGVEAGYSVVFCWSILTGLAVNNVSSWSNLAGSVGISLYCLYQYQTNKKD